MTLAQTAPQAHRITSNLTQALCAGNARFTLRNTASGNRLTYRMQVCDDKPTLFFVQVLTGADNAGDYTYLGTIRDGVYTHGRKSRITDDAQSAKTFAWFWEKRAALPGCVEVWHEGHCLRCGRVLTVPQSIAQGYGPECIQLVGQA